MRRLSLLELQAEEIQTIVGGKKQPIWIFVVLDVWSRLWPATRVGKRSYRNTLDLFRDVSKRMILPSIPLIATDGFKFYQRAIGRVFGPTCVYGKGDQDAPERSSGQSRAQSHNRSSTIETSSTGLGGFRDTEHLVCRAAESHPAAGLSVSGSPNDLSGPVEGTSRRSARAASPPLQFREASSRIEIWTGSQDASPTGWPDPQAADFERSLLLETAFWVVEQCPIHALLLGSAVTLTTRGAALAA